MGNSRVRSRPAQGALCVTPCDASAAKKGVIFGGGGERVRSHRGATLAELELGIERGLRAFAESGKALRTIRDSHLYRDSHLTFDEYCWKRWCWKRSRVYQLMDAAEVIENLSTIVDKPKNKAQVRELVGLEPEQQREAWPRAVETSKTGRRRQTT